MFKNAKKFGALVIALMILVSVSTTLVLSVGDSHGTQTASDTWVEDVDGFTFDEKNDDFYTEVAPSRSEYPFPNHYPSVEELYDWYDDLVEEFPNLASKIHIGYSWEGRDLWVMTLTSDEDVKVDEKPEILIDGSMHAREWSGPQVASYLMWRLLNEYDTNETIYWLLNNRVINIMPIQNPDGYTYDGNGVYEDRAGWRKNRNDSTPTSAIGVDLNRNWDINWAGGGSSDVPGSDVYHGEAPLSEYENKYLSEFMLSRNVQSTTIFTVITVHYSYRTCTPQIPLHMMNGIAGWLPT
ncbi:MAG: M14 family zinc carboxypeptidase [Thermoplasmata archaeon]